MEFNLRDKTIAMLEFESQTFMSAYEQNYEKWQTLKKYTGEITWENHLMFYTELEASRHLQNWIRQRFDNIDKNINNIIELFERN